MQWKPIEDLAPDAESWDEDLYRRARERWSRARSALQSTDVDQTALDLWTAERHRLFAIETGQIEDLYTLKRGMTEMLVTEGLENARASHTIEGVLDDRTLRGLLEDQHDAMEMVFRSVTDKRPLSQSAIKEWHALLTRHQDTAPGRDTLGRRIGIPFVKGAYKRRPNNPRTPDGTIHEYCPPEHTDSEMERLVAMHHQHERERTLPAPIEAAWLHHRFVQIHPFEDGNGRVARLLMSFVFAKRGEPSPIINADEKLDYFDVLQAADRGDTRPFVTMLQIRSHAALVSASRSAEAILAGRTRYYHANGDLSSKDADQTWSRRQSRHSMVQGEEAAPGRANEAAGEPAHDEGTPAAQARRVHEGRTRHPSPEVRADAHVALAGARLTTRGSREAGRSARHRRGDRKQSGRGRKRCATACRSSQRQNTGAAARRRNRGREDAGRARGVPRSHRADGPAGRDARRRPGGEPRRRAVAREIPARLSPAWTAGASVRRTQGATGRRPS